MYEYKSHLPFESISSYSLLLSWSPTENDDDSDGAFEISVPYGVG